MSDETAKACEVCGSSPPHAGGIWSNRRDKYGRRLWSCRNPGPCARAWTARKRGSAVGR